MATNAQPISGVNTTPPIWISSTWSLEVVISRLTTPAARPASAEPDQREAQRPHASSSPTAAPESRSLGRKPRAPLRRISSAESDQSRLEVRTTAGAPSSPVSRRRDVEAVLVGELDVEQDDVRP